MRFGGGSEGDSLRGRMSQPTETAPAESEPQKSILLLELQNEADFRHFRAELLPFVQGYLVAQGWSARWRVLLVPPEHMHSGGRFVVDLPDTHRKALCAEMEGEVPDVVLTNDPLSSPLAEFLRGHFPETRIVAMSSIPGVFGSRTRVSDLRVALGGGPNAEPTDADSEYVVDVADPSFAHEILVAGEHAPEPQPLRLVGGASCLYRRSVSKNPHYRHLDTETVAEFRGCTFCEGFIGDSLRHPYQTPPAELAAKQIAAHQRQVGGAEPKYIIDDAWLSRHPSALFDRLLDHGIRPARFYLNLRIDDFLAIREELEGLLSRLSTTGHSIHLKTVGAENFSAEENERFNKNITADQLWEGFEAICDLEERFPGTFSFREEGSFSAILFTPWTKLGDVRVNLDAGRRLGLEWTRYLLGTRLQIRPGSAIHALAEADGLLAEDFPDTAFIEPVCLTGPGYREIPWRFADPATALAHRLLIRLEPVPRGVDIPPDDALFRELNQCRRVVPPALDRDYIALMEALLAAIESRGSDASLEELFAWIRESSSAFVEPGNDSHGLAYGQAGLAADVIVAAMNRWGSKMGPYRLQSHRLRWKTRRWLVELSFTRPGRTFELTLDTPDGETRCWLSSEQFALMHAGSTPADPAIEQRLGRSLLRVLERNMPSTGGGRGKRPDESSE